MKKIIVLLLTVMMAAGFNWSLPQKTAAADQTSAKGPAVLFMTSVATLDFQGQKTQNRAQMVSLAKIDRRPTSTGATYALSGQGGLRIGKDGKGGIYEMSPLTVNRDSADRLSSNKKGLAGWLNVVNGTLAGLNHKHMVSEAWEEPIALSLGDGFPEKVQIRFSARPLPEPDDRWTLVTAESGMISFRALGGKTLDPMIYGRYRGLLVYSPEEDVFLQAAAAFIVYHGEDQFRVEQVNFAADKNGKQLHPLLNVGPYLDFKPQAPAIAAQGPFPSWCIQAARVLDVLDLAVMTAAEGSTNWISIAGVERSLLNLINHDYTATEKVLGKAAADQLLGDWMKLINFWNTQHKEGTFKAMLELGWDLSKDLYMVAVKALPYGIGGIYQIMELDFTVAKAVEEQMDHDLNKVTRAPFSKRVLKPQPTPPVDNTWTPESRTQETPPPPKPKKRIAVLPIVLGVAALTVGVLVGLKPKSGGSSCTWKVLFDAEADRVLHLGGVVLRGNYASEAACQNYQRTRPQYEQNHSQCVCR